MKRIISVSGTEGRFFREHLLHLFQRAPLQSSGTHGNAKKKKKHDETYSKGKSYTELKATTKIRRHTVFQIPTFSLRV